MKDEKPPLSPSVLLAEIQQLVERAVSVATQGTLEIKRFARLYNANQQLDARRVMQLTDVTERLERAASKMARAADANRPPSVTVVQDVPAHSEDDTGVFFHFKGERRKVPTKVLVPLMLATGGIAHWLGAHFPDILKWISSL